MLWLFLFVDRRNNKKKNAGAKAVAPATSVAEEKVSPLEMSDDKSCALASDDKVVQDVPVGTGSKGVFSDSKEGLSEPEDDDKGSSVASLTLDSANGKQNVNRSCKEVSDSKTVGSECKGSEVGEDQKCSKECGEEERDPELKQRDADAEMTAPIRDGDGGHNCHDGDEEDDDDASLSDLLPEHDPQQDPQQDQSHADDCIHAEVRVARWQA